MSEKDSTKPAKPAKPYPKFPLTAHPAGYWCKKIRGKIHYFGPWDDPDGALQKYLAQKDDLHAGRTPRSDPDALTVKELCNTFLTARQARVESGELSPRMWADYKAACDEVIGAFGKSRLVSDLRPGDFSRLRNTLAKRWGPVRLGNFVQYVRTVFKFAHDSELTDKPVRFGPDFKRPTRKTIRLHKAARGVKLFSAEEVRKL